MINGSSCRPSSLQDRSLLSSGEEDDRPPSSTASETPLTQAINQTSKNSSSDKTLMKTLSLIQKIRPLTNCPSSSPGVESLISRSLTSTAFGTWIGQAMSEFDQETYMQCSRELNNVLFRYMQVNYQRQQQQNQKKSDERTMSEGQQSYLPHTTESQNDCPSGTIHYL